MAFEDILVHTASHAHWPPHVSYAARLAARLSSRVTGIYVRGLIDTFGLPDDPALLASLAAARHEDVEQARHAGESFSNLVRAAGVAECDWLVGEGDPAQVIALAGAAHDLLVMGIGPLSGSRKLAIQEAVVLESGMPCLLVPDVAAVSERPIERILIGWNGSVEAMRSLRSALPLLSTATKVVLCSGPPSARRKSMPSPPPLDAEAVLQRHGIAFESHALGADGNEAGPALLMAGEQAQADLLVMGAWGHAPVREWLLGGATRHVLRNSHIPLLLRH